MTAIGRLAPFRPTGDDGRYEVVNEIQTICRLREGRAVVGLAQDFQRSTSSQGERYFRSLSAMRAGCADVRILRSLPKGGQAATGQILRYRKAVRPRRGRLTSKATHHNFMP
jgi:hypothetical protein